MAKHCPKQNCEKKCVRYDSWECSEDECGKVTEKVKTIVIKKHEFCQDMKACKKWGFSERCEGDWECKPVCQEKPKLVKKHHDNHHNKH